MRKKEEFRQMASRSERLVGPSECCLLVQYRFNTELLYRVDIIDVTAIGKL